MIENIETHVDKICKHSAERYQTKNLIAYLMNKKRYSQFIKLTNLIFPQEQGLPLEKIESDPNESARLIKYGLIIEHPNGGYISVLNNQNELETFISLMFERAEYWRAKHREQKEKEREDKIESGYNVQVTSDQELHQIHTSKGEFRVGSLLTAANISFIKEYTAFKNPETQRFLRYDFFVENRYLIEFDGQYHYQKDEVGKALRERDALKNEWAKEHNLPLIRIPYFIVDRLTLTDLIPETSRFLVK